MIKNYYMVTGEGFYFFTFGVRVLGSCFICPKVNPVLAALALIKATLAPPLCSFHQVVQLIKAST